MSQNPYAQGADFAPPPESRTSILGILSLICSLVCLIPGLGILGAILGVSSLVAITRSRGALRGNGLAVTGIVVGLLVSVIWVGIGIGLAYANAMFSKSLVNPAAAVLQAIDVADYTTARAALEPALGTALTDEQVADFGTSYHADLGRFVSVPQSLGDRASAYFEVLGSMQNYQNQNNRNVVPIPARFDKGLTLLLVELPMGVPPTRPGGSALPPLLNVGVLTPAGKEIWLLARPGAAPLPPPAPTPGPAPGGQAPPPGG